MTAPWVRVEPLSDAHDIDSFQCGLASVDAWLHDKARSATREHRVATHVCVDDAGAVVAFYALRQIVVSVEGAARRMRDTAEDGASATGILLAQMGVAELHQGGGSGKALVAQAMRTAAESHDLAPYRLFVVDAANSELVSFYEKFELKLLRGSDLRLATKMSTVRKVVNRLDG